MSCWCSQTASCRHRSAWRIWWRRKSRARRPGRRRLDPAVITLIQRLHTENPTRGPRRIQGELHQLEIGVSRATIQRDRASPPPSPSWRTFLRLHAPEIWACDLFTVQTLAFRTLSVFFVITHERRAIVHWNVTPHPTAAWVWQQIREATPWGQHPRSLIRDRDTRFGGDFIPRAPGYGIETVLTPFRAPQANALAERVVGTFRRECFDHVLVWNERHLRRVFREYIAFYNAARPQQALGQVPPAGERACGRPGTRVVGDPVLGGLHHIYRWAA